MVRAVTLIPGTTEFGYEPATVVQALGPGQSAPENRHVAHAPSDVDRRARRSAGGRARTSNASRSWSPGSATICAPAHCAREAGRRRSRSSRRYPADLVGRGRRPRRRASRVDGRRPAGLRRHAVRRTASTHLIAELKARGLKVTLYPFVMMDIPAGNALPDPWTGAASQPAYPWRGRITCDPAPGSRARPTAARRAATQVDAFFGGGDPDGWNYRRMVLHYAQLAADAGGVDAFLIGSELRGLTRVRSASGVYPAVTRLAELAADVKAIVGGGTDRHLRRRLDRIRRACGRSAARAKCAFRSIRCGRRRRSTSSASTTTRRSPTGATAPAHLDRALADTIYDRRLSRRQSARRRGLRLVLRRRRGARRADAHADHRRARQAVGVPRQGSLELVAQRALRARRRRRARLADRLGAAGQADLAHRDRLPARSTRARTSRTCFPIRSRPKPACRISPTAGATT